MKKTILVLLFVAALGASAVADTLITTREGLAAIAANAESLAGTYALGADIDLGGADWTPLGTESAPFTGELHGNGHAIRNLICTNNPSGNSCRGLFGCASNATIQSVSVSGTVSGKQYVGGLVGRARGGMVISNCSAAVEVTATGSYAGGLVGSCDGGSATNRIVGCRADGFTEGNGFVGGFIGYVYTPAAISNCAARGDVRSVGSDYGGFVGRLAHDSATIDDCWSSGAVWGTGGNIGSFIGNWQSGTITNCAASAYANGLRLFCGSSTDITGSRLTLSDVHARSAGWPSAQKRSNSASVTPIATVEDFLSIMNDLAGRYVLVADIDFEGETIEPIGNYGTAFTGEFYGQNHRILGYCVETGERYAGLFGKIAGGRVSGVRAEGSVIGGPTVSGSDVGVGGFAGKIDSKSLVEGCSFDGEVANTTTCNAGGFVGYTTDSPVILRCRAWGMVDNSSDKSGTGGFIGNHSGGSITDCCALMECTATDNGDASAGGFAGLVASAARIAASWCSGCVDSRAGYVGAFVGKANGSGLITGSYYDTGANSDMGAVGKNSGGSAAYAGITPVDIDGKFHAESYPSFDFTNTWSIVEGMDEPRLVTQTGFTDFLDDSYLPLGADPTFVANGIPVGLRYVYDIPADATSLYALPGEPFFRIVMDADGNPCVKFRAKRDPHGGVEAAETILATEDLTDWTHLIPMRHDALDGTWKPAAGVYPDQMFFRWRINVVRVDE